VSRLQAQIRRRGAPDARALVRGRLAHHARRHADEQRVRRDDLPLAHHRAGADDAAGTEHRAVEHQRAHPDQHLVLHGRAVHDRTMTDAHPGA
jgi:hypothetical protein